MNTNIEKIEKDTANNETQHYNNNTNKQYSTCVFKQTTTHHKITRETNDKYTIKS